MPFPVSFFRLRARPPAKDPPPKNFIDCFYDPTTGKIIAKNDTGQSVLFDAAGGAVSTGDLTTSNGSADAAAGQIGEYLENGPATLAALTTDISANQASISLTAGDWDVSGFLAIGFTGATGSTRGASISTTSASPATDGVGYANTAAFSAFSGFEANAVPQRRIKITSTTTVYLVASATFSGGSVSASGQLAARRVR